MPVVARSLVNYSQTISGQTIPPMGTRTYQSASSALTTAQTNGLVKLSDIPDSQGAQPYNPEGASGQLQAVTPIAGDNVTVDDGTEQLLLTPAGTLATLTITMPLAPYDGQVVRIATTAALTAVTHAGNGKTINAGLTAMSAGGFAHYRYRASNTTWYRVG